MLNLPLCAAHWFALRGASCIRIYQKTFYILYFQVYSRVPMDYKCNFGGQKLQKFASRDYVTLNFSPFLKK